MGAVKHILWTPADTTAARKAYERRMATFNGLVVHPKVHGQMVEWAWFEALDAATESQFSGIVRAKGIPNEQERI